MNEPPRARDEAVGGGPLALAPSRPVATTMAVLAVATFGLLSLFKIPVELLPEISYPTITVRTEYEGAGPEDVEKRVTEPIEEALAVVPGLASHSSVSRAGVSDVQLRFSWNVPLSLATQEIRERLDRVRLPDDADSPLILRYDPSLEPVMRIMVSGSLPLDEMRRVAEEDVARVLATVSGVAAVKVRGGLEEEIRVTLDAAKLTQLGLDISEVDRRLRIENVNLASGTLVEGDTQYVVRTLNQFLSLDEILDLAVADRGGEPIRLRDLARVERTHRERDVVTRVDGREAVELEVHREADANIVELAERLRDRLFGTKEQRRLLAAVESGRVEDPEVALKRALREEERKTGAVTDAATGRSSGDDRELAKLRHQAALLRAARDAVARRLAPKLRVDVVSDQSIAIREAIEDVQNAALLGGLLAVLVLLFFLQNVRATAIIAAAIPISIVATFAPMYLAGTTLNIMSLGGLALGIGMLVDNSIVVLESIFRCREEGEPWFAAAVRGTREVGGAVFASTLTTVAVFFPITFVSGVAGQLFGDQALTVVFSLLSSLVVALFFIPMLAARGRSDVHRLPPGRVLKGLLGPVAAPSRSLTARSARGRARPLAAAAFLIQWPLESAGRLLAAAVAALVALLVLLARSCAGLLARLAAPLVWIFDRLYGRVEAVYPRLLGAILRRPLASAVVLLVAAAALGGSLRLTSGLGAVMMPTVHQGALLVHVRAAVGTPVERTAALLEPVEREIARLPGVARVAASIGVARDEIADPDEGSHSARLLVALEPSDDLAAAEEATLEKLRDVLRRRPEIVGLRFSRPTVFSVRAPLEIRARGDDLEAIRSAAEDVARALAGSDAVRDVRTNLSRGRPEVRLRFDRERLRRFGLDLEAIANRIRAQVQGVVSTRYAAGDRRIDVRVLSDVDTLDELLDVTVNRGRAVGLTETLDRGREGGGASTGSGSSRIRDRTLLPGVSVDLGGDAPIPLREVANVELVRGPAEIRHVHGQRAAIVTARPSGLDVRGAVRAVSAELARIERRHPDVLLEIGGQGAEMDEALESMRSALLLAVFLVYLVMASQFESVIQPLILLLTVPLALVGAILALYWTRTPISVVVLIGGIVLAGIVVNNAIVLVDYTNRLRRRGRSPVEALIEAGRARLRPILMTASSTVLALLPLCGAFSWVPGLPEGLRSFVRGSELQAPLAVTVIGGLTLSTLLTLLVVPAAYRLVSGRDAG